MCQNLARNDFTLASSDVLIFAESRYTVIIKSRDEAEVKKTIESRVNEDEKESYFDYWCQQRDGL